MKTVIINVLIALSAVWVQFGKNLPEKYLVWVALAGAVINVVIRLLQNETISIGRSALRDYKRYIKEENYHEIGK